MILSRECFVLEYIHRVSQLNPKINAVTLLDRIKRASLWGGKGHSGRRLDCQQCGVRKYVAPVSILGKGFQDICFDCCVGHPVIEIMGDNIIR